jgi:hypothetical protein
LRRRKQKTSNSSSDSSWNGSVCLPSRQLGFDRPGSISARASDSVVTIVRDIARVPFTPRTVPPPHLTFRRDRYQGRQSREGVRTLSLVRRAVREGTRRVGFWVVLDDADAPAVRALFLNGRRFEAMILLDHSAKHLGRILPSDTGPQLH